MIDDLEFCYIFCENTYTIYLIHASCNIVCSNCNKKLGTGDEKYF